jgi:hypothetical protein
LKEQRPRKLLDQDHACPACFASPRACPERSRGELAEGTPSTSGITLSTPRKLMPTERHGQGVFESSAARPLPDRASARLPPAGSARCTRHSPCRWPSRRWLGRGPGPGRQKDRCRHTIGRRRTARRLLRPCSQQKPAWICRAGRRVSPRCRIIFTLRAVVLLLNQEDTPLQHPSVNWSTGIPLHGFLAVPTTGSPRVIDDGFPGPTAAG